MLSGRPHVQEGHPAQLMCPLCSACLSLDGDGTPSSPGISGSTNAGCVLVASGGFLHLHGGDSKKCDLAGDLE